MLATLVAVLGLSTIWSTVNALWALWMTDALKSIGMFIPLVSFVLILRAWRSLGWEMEGGGRCWSVGGTRSVDNGHTLAVDRGYLGFVSL